ncbi:CBS domain-containing protein [Patescibacteria group bacterium]|nr:CBS domain-containing protein [Patescibacteria group bacterium]
MLKVKDIMSTDLLTVTPDTEVTQAAKLLVERHINGIPVVDDQGKLKGILCQSDLIAQQKSFPLPSFFTLLDGIIPLKSGDAMEAEVKKIAAVTVGEAMTANPVFVTPEDSVQTVANLMVGKKYHTLPVVEGGMLVGVVGKEDVLRTLLP